MTTRNQFTAVFKKTQVTGLLLGLRRFLASTPKARLIAEARENLREALSLILETNRRSSRSQIKRSRTARRELIDITLPA
jgi:hypothetical protein